MDRYEEFLTKHEQFVTNADVRLMTIDLETTIVDGSPDPKDGAEVVMAGGYYKAPESS